MINSKKEYLQEINECSDYLNRQDKLDVIKQIKHTLLDRYYNISQLEADILAQNIYDYCCLTINGISKEKIVKYILKKNSEIYDSLTEKEKDKLTIGSNINFFKHLIKKYTTILKENDKVNNKKMMDSMEKRPEQVFLTTYQLFL